MANLPGTDNITDIPASDWLSHLDDDIGDFKAASLGREVRGGFTDMAEVIANVIDKQAVYTDDDLTDTSPNAAAQAAAVGKLVLKYWERDTDDTDTTFTIADMPVNSIIYVHPASKFTDKPPEINNDTWISIKKENLTESYGAVCLITVYDSVNNITMITTYRNSDHYHYPWKFLSTKTYWHYEDLHEETDTFSIADMPVDSYTYVTHASDFIEKPFEIDDNALISIKKENMTSSYGALSLITVFNPTNNITYVSTYRRGSTLYDPKLYPWRKVLKNTNNRHTVNIFNRVLCVGDSYTEGYINIGSGGAAHKEYSWPHYMEKLTGNDWINCGVSGATTLSWLTNPNGLAAAQAAGRVQAYVIGLMINDATPGQSYSVPVGTSADIGTDNPTTYYGGLSKIIRELNAISPLAKIFVTTCPTGSDKTAYQQAVRDICEAYKNTYPVHLIDLKKDEDMYMESSFSGDRINNHHTALGYEQMAEIYVDILSGYIDTHVSDFQNVHEIPYDGG